MSMHPLQALLQQQLLTPDFVQLYSFAFASQLLDEGNGSDGEAIVIGWDPRPSSVGLAMAAATGIRKAKLTAVMIGVQPTPAVPLVMQVLGAAGGIMITASHNPKDQNGIKLFLAPFGLKQLPADEARLTHRTLAIPWRWLRQAAILAPIKDYADQATSIFASFCQHPDNSWLDPYDLANYLIIVDPARGSYCGVAAKIISHFHPHKLLSVNDDGDHARINEGGGAADLEGVSWLPASDLGRFSEHQALAELVRQGRANDEAIRNSHLRAVALIFDGDGDRFFAAEYFPDSDSILVNSGDVVAAWLATYLRTSAPDRLSAMAVSTVESDLEVRRYLSGLGLDTPVTAVGDKCLLSAAGNAVCAALSDRLSPNPQFSRQLHLAAQTINTDTTAASSVLRELLRSTEVAGALAELREPGAIRFLVGQEATGHCVVPGRVKTEHGILQPVFAGNGLKAALNWLAATNIDGLQSPPAQRPYEPGIELTISCYQTIREHFYRESEQWTALAAKTTEILTSALGPDHPLHREIWGEEPDMIAFSADYPGGRPRLLAFIRNSGTEVKTTVNVRGCAQDQPLLQKLAETLAVSLAMTLRDRESAWSRAEVELLQLADRGSLTSDQIAAVAPAGVDPVDFIRVVSIKQKLLDRTSGLWRLTALGEQWLEVLK